MVSSVVAVNKQYALDFTHQHIYIDAFYDESAARIVEHVLDLIEQGEGARVTGAQLEYPVFYRVQAAYGLAVTSFEIYAAFFLAKPTLGGSLWLLPQASSDFIGYSEQLFNGRPPENKLLPWALEQGGFDSFTAGWVNQTLGNVGAVLGIYAWYLSTPEGAAGTGVEAAAAGRNGPPEPQQTPLTPSIEEPVAGPMKPASGSLPGEDSAPPTKPVQPLEVMTPVPKTIRIPSNAEIAAGANASLKEGAMATKAATAIESHGVRPGSAWPKLTGNQASKNAKAQELVSEILANPNRRINPRPDHPRFGDCVEVIAPDGRGLRVDPHGNFIGVIEP